MQNDAIITQSPIGSNAPPRPAMQPNPADPLEQFLHWFLTQGSRIGMVPLLGAVVQTDKVASIIWYRKAPFQVELFIIPPHYIVPEHTHPNVDSFEVYLGGQINFSHTGKYTTHWENQIPDQYGCSPLRGTVTRVRPNDPHGGTFGPSGGVFFSVQHWLNGVEPHRVGFDWDGAVVGPEHMARVVYGDAVLKPELTPKDAASGEF